MAKLTEKQKIFCDEYLIDLNATQAAIRAGYSIKTAYRTGCDNLIKPQIRKFIDGRLQQINSSRIAQIDEIMIYLTKGIRQELQEEIVVVEGVGEGNSSARTIKKQISLRDSNKCAELLGKRYGLFTDKVNLEVPIPIIIGGEDSLED